MRKPEERQLFRLYSFSPQRLKHLYKHLKHNTPDRSRRICASPPPPCARAHSHSTQPDRPAPPPIRAQRSRGVHQSLRERVARQQAMYARRGARGGKRREQIVRRTAHLYEGRLLFRKAVADACSAEQLPRDDHRERGGVGARRPGVLGTVRVAGRALLARDALPDAFVVGGAVCEEELRLRGEEVDGRAARRSERVDHARPERERRRRRRRARADRLGQRRSRVAVAVGDLDGRGGFLAPKLLVEGAELDEEAAPQLVEPLVARVEEVAPARGTRRVRLVRGEGRSVST
jgi:hypothetical protein